MPLPQGVHVELPPLEMLPGRQGAHAGGSAAASRYVPAAQSVQYDDPLLEKPAVQASHSVWPLRAAKVFGAHSRHAADALAPTSSLNFPGGHLLHLSAS